MKPTSLRFFCFRMANKKRAMALSLLGDMMADSCRIWVISIEDAGMEVDELNKALAR
jgi:hypothetical protein